MKCPRCGNEMVLDSHRKIPLNMCYVCGYIEGRAMDEGEGRQTNYDHLKYLNVIEMAAFISSGLKSKGLDVSESVLVEWLLEPKE